MATIVGDEDDNFLSGTADNDSIFGEGGDDFIAGNGGDDLLEGGSGRDQLHGGDGIDTVSYLGLEGGVHVDLGTGDGYTGEAAGDFIFEVENILGTNDYGDILVGSATSNSLYGEGGDDDLAGRGGSDWLYGGNGTDSASYAESGAAVSIMLDRGDGYSDCHGGDAEGDRLFSVENVGGSRFADTLTGNAGANVLSGMAGDDALVGGDGNDVLRGGAGADYLNGGAGGDTASYYTGTAGVAVNLAAGTGSGGEAQGDILIGIENLSGSQGGDSLVGNDGTNALQGWDGNDVLNGARGRDILTGGGGADRFIYAGTVHSPVGAGDLITDFSHAQGDRIDLSRIDADTGAVGNQVFRFIGTGTYTHHAGELRFALAQNGTTIIGGDVDGDGASDFHITLSRHVDLVAGDFVL